MFATRILRREYEPMIKFVGRRHTPPKNIDHAPHVHPAAPSDSLPGSFASYRGRAQSHGPLGGQQQPTPSTSSSREGAPSGSAAAQTAEPYGAIGGRSGRELGSVQPKQGEFWDRDELPKRFHRMRWTEAEMEALESGGASMW